MKLRHSIHLPTVGGTQGRNFSKLVKWRLVVSLPTGDRKVFVIQLFKFLCFLYCHKIPAINNQNYLNVSSLFVIRKRLATHAAATVRTVSGV